MRSKTEKYEFALGESILFWKIKDQCWVELTGIFWCKLNLSAGSCFSMPIFSVSYKLDSECFWWLKYHV